MGMMGKKPGVERTGVHRKAFFTLLFFGVVLWVMLACAAGAGTWWVRTVAEYPHDTNAFTQGLVVHGGRMYESTGVYGKSSLRRVDIETGKVEQMVSLDDACFGEGITVFGEKLYQLTWKNNIIIVYDVNTFDVLGTVPYSGEGWGLAHDGAHLILSDGSASLRFLDPETLEVEREITVHEGAAAVTRLNELEYVRGEIWANVWYQDRIVRISPLDGRVLGWIDLSSLSKRSKRSREEVLNGIAFDGDSGRLFVTGKNWPTLYEIEVMAL
jgi:glutaminyl-peptide cyclotransferase